jgi:hypothetical protein
MPGGASGISWADGSNRSQAGSADGSVPPRGEIGGRTGTLTLHSLPQGDAGTWRTRGTMTLATCTRHDGTETWRCTEHARVGFDAKKDMAKNAVFRVKLNLQIGASI